MERRIDLNEFFEIMGGQEEAEKFFDQVIEENIQKNVSSNANQIVSVVHSRVEQKNRFSENSKKFTISTMLIIERIEIEEHTIKLDLKCTKGLETKESHIGFEISPVLFYICDFDKEMPDCVLDMMNLSKQIKLRRDEGTFTDEWLLNELNNFPEFID
jgi:hypothetical protein